MKNAVRNLVIAIFITDVGLAIAGYMFISSLPDLCSDKIISENLSPDRKVKAVIFSRDCGATTGFITHLAIVPIHESTKSATSVFVADTNRGMAKAGPGGGPEFLVKWESDSSLLVAYSSKARVAEQKLKFRGVTVKYEERE